MIIEFEGYQIKPHKEIPTNYIVVTAGRGGKIPDVLDGVFTTPTIAKAAITNYISTKAK
jgi:NCAIR mutase (PurE)-related protein